MIKKCLFSSIALGTFLFYTTPVLASEDFRRVEEYYHNHKKIDIRHLDKPDLLVTLWERARGKNKADNYFIGHIVLPTVAGEPSTLTREKAQEILERYTTNRESIDYIQQRPLKVRLFTDSDYLDPRLYDREHGEEQALWAVREVMQNANRLAN